MEHNTNVMAVPTETAEQADPQAVDFAAHGVDVLSHGPEEKILPREDDSSSKLFLIEHNDLNVTQNEVHVESIEPLSSSRAESLILSERVPPTSDRPVSPLEVLAPLPASLPSPISPIALGENQSIELAFPRPGPVGSDDAHAEEQRYPSPPLRRSRTQRMSEIPRSIVAEDEDPAWIRQAQQHVLLERTRSNEDVSRIRVLSQLQVSLGTIEREAARAQALIDSLDKTKDPSLGVAQHTLSRDASASANARKLENARRQKRR